MSTEPKFVKNKLYLYWQAEAVRLHESQQGNLDDSNIENLVKSKYTKFDQRILYRASLLAKQEGINQILSNWSLSAKISIAILWLLALLSGIGVASGALAHTRVNLASALIALLGLHLISFILWLASYLPISRTTTGLSSVWLWLNKKLARKSQNTLAGQAFLTLFMRQKLWRSSVGIISNSTWLVAFIGALLALLVLLSTRNFSFYWATTLLSGDTFISISKLIGAIPAILGFPMPDDHTLAASLDAFNPDRELQTQWSIWLIGCVLVWGLLPRLIALLLCLLNLLAKLSRLKFAENLPDYLDLASKYRPQHQHLGIDKPAGKITQLIKPIISKNKISGKAAIMGFELDPDYQWPPQIINKEIIDLGIVASRNDQNQIRDKIDTKINLLLICNTAITPDRGTLNWLRELQDISASLSIYCPPGLRSQLWQQIISTHGFAQTDSINNWLAEFNLTGQA